MEVTGKKAIAFIIVPPSGVHVQWWSTWSTCGMEELCPILYVPYKFQSSQHNSLAEINVCCLSCNKPRPH